MKNWSLSTTTGCRRLLALCLALMLIFSFAAHWMSTEGGAVKNVRVSFDARGATLDGELYYPAGTTDEDKLPGVVVTCGAGCTFGVTSGIAQELARRGFVVLNMSAYGTGRVSSPSATRLARARRTTMRALRPAACGIASTSCAPSPSSTRPVWASPVTLRAPAALPTLRPSMRAT